MSSIVLVAFYLLLAAMPAAALFLRGRGWRPRWLLISLLVSWTGGGWAVMMWLAIMEREGNWEDKPQVKTPPAARNDGRPYFE